MDTITTIRDLLTCNGSAQPVMVSLTRDESRLIAAAPTMAEALEWIIKIADANYEQDEGLRSRGARTLKRISEKAGAALAKARGE